MNANQRKERVRAIREQQARHRQYNLKLKAKMAAQAAQREQEAAASAAIYEESKKKALVETPEVCIPEVLPPEDKNLNSFRNLLGIMHVLGWRL